MLESGGEGGEKALRDSRSKRVEISAAPTTTLLSRQFIYLIYLFSVFSYNTRTRERGKIERRRFPRLGKSPPALPCR